MWIAFGLSVRLFAVQAPPRPNILWICADDHAPYVMGAYGNRQVRTLNLDRLASQGVRFDRAYCNSPVCTASRQSFLTGRYPRTIGVTQLKTPLSESEITLAEILKEAGYVTAAFGKMHFNSTLKHGFDLRLDQPEYQAWLKKKGRTPVPTEIEVQPPWKPFKDPASIWLNSACRPLAVVDADMYGTFLAREASEFLRAPRSKPFFLMVSFTEPHSPFHFPIEYRNRHQLAVFKVPKPGSGDDAQIPKIFRDLTGQEKQGITAAYYTSVEFLDRNIGVVLEALERSGQATNTLVIYTGDHGYMLGQHGRFEKHCGYEPAVRAPLLVRFDRHIKPQQSRTALVEFIDIFPTVLEFAGLSVPANAQGKSLVPLLLGKARRHRDRVFIEYSENEEAYVVTERWKFIYGTGKRTREDGYAAENPLPGRTIRLFDLDADPSELKNLAKQREHARRVEQFTRQLAEHLKRTARQPELLPKSDDPHAILEFCLQPKDIGTESGAKR
ncbi:MAG: sulfatase [Verrucomicrobia bacterium]|nr:sulfatase [Verrucomicrobiota bacterium]